MQVGEFRKSSFSPNNSPECVEIASTDSGGWLVRDSKNPDGPVLEFTRGEVNAFGKGVVAGEFGKFD